MTGFLTFADPNQGQQAVCAQMPPNPNPMRSNPIPKFSEQTGKQPLMPEMGKAYNKHPDQEAKASSPRKNREQPQNAKLPAVTTEEFQGTKKKTVDRLG